MTIRGKLYLHAALLSLLISLAIGTAIYFSTRVDRELARAAIAQDLARDIAELFLLTDEYLAYHAPRMEVQWASRSQRIRDKLTASRELIPTDRLFASFDSLTRAFNQLSTLFHARQQLIQGDDPTQDLERIGAIQDRVAARIRMDSQKLLSQTFILARNAQQEAQHLQRQGTRAGGVLGLAVIALSLLTTLALANNLNKKIALLVAGARRIGEGQLDQPIHLPPKDEAGTLAEAINQMARDLSTLLETERQAVSRLNNEIRERRQVEAQLAQLNRELEARVQARTAELELSNRDLESFSYSVSHDLRAPLRAINGYCALLEENLAARLEGTDRRFLTTIRQTAGQMSQLIDDLLAFAHLGKRHLELEKFSPVDLVQQCLEQLRKLYPEHQFTVEIGNLPVVQADPALLKQVYLNLLDNAFKFTGKSPAARIELGASETAGSVHFFVRDNGVGFDMRHAGKLFDVFTRLHRSEDFPGTGVGLALVRRIIERHGGRIWVESQPGQGTAFFFTLAEG